MDDADRDVPKKWEARDEYSLLLMIMMMPGDIEEYYKDDDGDDHWSYEDEKNLGQGMMKRRKGGVVGGSVDVSSSLWRGKVFSSIVGYYFARRSITISNLLNVLY